MGMCKCDGTSVTGEVCKVKAECLRHTFIGNPYRQAWMEAPVKDGLCEWWVDNTDYKSPPVASKGCKLVVEIIEE